MIPMRSFISTERWEVAASARSQIPLSQRTCKLGGSEKGSLLGGWLKQLLEQWVLTPESLITLAGSKTPQGVFSPEETTVLMNTVGGKEWRLCGVCMT